MPSFKLGKNNFRYLYWVLSAFVKKNVQLILMSFLGSLLIVVITVSFAPYVINLVTSKREVIGVAGTYSIDSLPDEIVSEFSNGLLYVNDVGELIPLLVDSWEPVDGGKEYQFHLKKDLVWNDGTPFKAQDISYSFKDVEVIADNDYLLRFKLKKPLAIFPNFLTRPIVKYPMIGVAGMYKAGHVKISAGNISQLQLNPNKEGESVKVYKFYDTESKLIQAYKLGEITEMTTNKSTVADNFRIWKNTKVEQRVDYSKVMTLFYNLNDQFLAEDKDIRKAIAESIDKSAFELFGEEAFSPIPPTSWAYNPDVRKYTYNPSVSEKIINKYTEASDSAQLKISTYYDHLGVADSIAENLKKVGLETKIELLGGDLPQNYNLFLAMMRLGNDPDQYFFWHSTQPKGNVTSYKNVRVDKLLEDGRNTYALEKRKEIYLDFQKIIAEDMPAYFMYYPYQYLIKRK